jgi:hypothetical protein
VDKHTRTVDNLGNAPTGPDTPNVSDPSPKLPAMTGLVTETHLMKGSEVRDLLHIGKTTLHDWRVAGRIEAIRHHPKSPWFYPANQGVIVAALRAVGSLR